MQEYDVILTWEAIYDVTDIADYIEAEFGEERAERFQTDIQSEIGRLKSTGSCFAKTQVYYRGYAIHKKPFPPSVIFYVLMDREIHILRVLREEKDWKQVLERKIEYTYPDK